MRVHLPHGKDDSDPRMTTIEDAAAPLREAWYYAVPRPQEPWSKGNQLIDRFEYDWKKRRYIPNHL